MLVFDPIDGILPLLGKKFVEEVGLNGGAFDKAIEFEAVFLVGNAGSEEAESFGEFFQGG